METLPVAIEKLVHAHNVYQALSLLKGPGYEANCTDAHLQALYTTLYGHLWSYYNNAMYSTIVQERLLYLLVQTGHTILVTDSLCLLLVSCTLQCLSQLFPRCIDITAEPGIGHTDLAEGAIVHSVCFYFTQFGSTDSQVHSHRFPFRDVHQLIGDVAYG